MTPEELRIRSLYLFLVCAQAVERACRQLSAALTQVPDGSRALAERTLTRELGLLFRYWTTRQIWQELDARETDAKQLNLALLRLFTNRFKLPQDGSGLHYAELSTLVDEVRELGQRITQALRVESPPVLAELQGSIGSWRALVAQATSDALHRPTEELAAAVKEWAEASPDAETSG